MKGAESQIETSLPRKKSTLQKPSLIRVKNPKHCFILFFTIKYWKILSISSFLIDLWSTEKSYTVPIKEIYSVNPL